MQDIVQLAARGGWVMGPIGLCSVAALGLFLERLWGTRRSAVSPPALQTNVESLLARRLVKQALALCRGTPSALGRVLAAGIRLFSAEEGSSRGVTRAEVKDALEAAGRREADDLRRFVGALATIATIAPLLGLLGTVWGMVETFQQIEGAEVVTKAVMAGGIWKALLTTVAGLIVAIPTVIAHRIVTARVNDRITELETGAERTAELLLRPESGEARPDTAEATQAADATGARAEPAADAAAASGSSAE